LAHLRRWDDWTNLAQQVLKALLFFHPAVWWIENQLALEREMACDDAVLAETGNPRGYAQCLISMAEKSFLRRGLALAQAAVNRMRQTSLRVSQILDINRPSATRIWKPALYSVAAFFVLCLVSLSHAPELVAFQDRMPDAALASATSPHGTLTSAAAVNFLETPPIARPVTFRTKSAAPRARLGSKYRIQERTRSLAPQNAAYQIRVSMSSPIPHSAEFRTWEGASSLPHSAANNSGLDPLRQQVSGEASSTTIGQPVLSQAIFVVMDAHYDQFRPSVTITVWRVTVLNSSRPEIRIPAKQI